MRRPAAESLRTIAAINREEPSISDLARRPPCGSRARVCRCDLANRHHRIQKRSFTVDARCASAESVNPSEAGEPARTPGEFQCDAGELAVMAGLDLLNRVPTQAILIAEGTRHESSCWGRGTAPVSDLRHSGARHWRGGWSYRVLSGAARAMPLTAWRTACRGGRRGGRTSCVPSCGHRG